jgi:hypothetical protein
MSLRFRRRIKIIPGVHLNISRSGISTSVGVRGASLTLGKQGTYLNTGVPGTGVSWRGRISEPASTQNIQPISEQPSAEAVPTLKHTHHLHWWKILIFIATLLIAGATKSNGIIGIFWLFWFGYWLFLFLRLIARTMKSNVKQST